MLNAARAYLIASFYYDLNLPIMVITTQPEAAKKLGVSAHEMIDKMGLDTDSHLDKLEKYYADILKNRQTCL